MRGCSGTHIDQSKVVLIDWELLRADVFLQSRGIGALENQTGHKRYSHIIIIITIKFKTGEKKDTSLPQCYTGTNCKYLFTLFGYDLFPLLDGTFIVSFHFWQHHEQYNKPVGL